MRRDAFSGAVGRHEVSLKLKRHPCTNLTTDWLGRLIAAISPRWVSLESVAPKVASLYRLRFSWSLGSLASANDCEFANLKTNRTRPWQINFVPFKSGLRRRFSPAC